MTMPAASSVRSTDRRLGRAWASERVEVIGEHVENTAVWVELNARAFPVEG